MVEEEDATFRDQVADREIDMVLDIKIICRMIEAIAEHVGVHNHVDEIINEKRKRYLVRKEKAMELAKGIINDFYRAVAFRQIIDLCVAANDSNAKDLLREIRVKFIRDKIKEAHPGLLL
jgi:hypothetical protein